MCKFIYNKSIDSFFFDGWIKKRINAQNLYRNHIYFKKGVEKIYSCELYNKMNYPVKEEVLKLYDIWWWNLYRCEGNT